MFVLARVRNSGVRDKIENVFARFTVEENTYADLKDELIQGDEPTKLAYEEKNATR